MNTLKVHGPKATLGGATVELNGMLLDVKSVGITALCDGLTEVTITIYSDDVEFDVGGGDGDRVAAQAREGQRGGR
jgi:hypothetical protein